MHLLGALMFENIFVLTIVRRRRFDRILQMPAFVIVFVFVVILAVIDIIVVGDDVPTGFTGPTALLYSTLLSFLLNQ